MFSITSNVESGVGVVVDGVRVTAVSVSLAVAIDVSATELVKIPSIVAIINTIVSIFLLFLSIAFYFII
jgi:hypothetical protein